MTSPDDLLALDAQLDDTEQATAETVRAFLDDRVRPHIARWYHDASLPVRDLAQELGAMGLFGMQLEGHGCAGATATMYGVACRELEAVDTGLRTLVSVQGSLAMFALHAFGSREQQDTWLPAMATGAAVGCFALTEPDAGSDPASMRTRARRDGSDWVLQGTKMWITNAPVADVAVVWAGTQEGVRGFVVPTSAPGFSVRPVPGKLSLRASVTGQVWLDDLRLPQEAILPGAKGLRGPLTCLTEARYGIVWGTVGSIRETLTTTLRYAATRTQFGRPVAGFQLTQAKFADATAAYAKAALLAVHLGRLKDAGTLTPELVSVAKLDNARAALAVARSMRTVLGGSGVTVDYPAMRHAANLETVLTYEGTQEVHQLVVGAALTGIDAFR